MSNPTFDQAFQLLSVVREADKTLEGLQALYATGLLSDLLKTEDPAKVDREAFRKLLGFDPSSFRVKMGAAETTDEIVAYLNANGFNYVNEWINQKNFPLKAKETPEDDEIVIYDPGTSFTEEEGLAILKREGLLRPTYEHGLRFAREHGTATTSAKKPFVIFLHEPWQDPDGDRRIVYVNRYPDNRGLDLYYPVNGFYGDCVLAGVRPRK
jgi:hypothetical protein